MSISLSNLRADDNFNKPNERPNHGPEIDDDIEPGDSGVDDGLLPEPRSRRPSLTPSGADPRYNPSLGDFPHSVGPGFDAVYPPIATIPGRVDVNVYQQKKTLAQGMMDIALLSANAGQLRYVLDYQGMNPYYYLSLVLISTSLVFQVAVGVGLILNSRYNIKKEDNFRAANRINDFTVIGIFIVTITNIFVTAFGISHPYEHQSHAAPLISNVNT